MLSTDTETEENDEQQKKDVREYASAVGLCFSLFSRELLYQHVMPRKVWNGPSYLCPQVSPPSQRRVHRLIVAQLNRESFPPHEPKIWKRSGKLASFLLLRLCLII